MGDVAGDVLGDNNLKVVEYQFLIDKKNLGAGERLRYRGPTYNVDEEEKFKCYKS